MLCSLPSFVVAIFKIISAVLLFGNLVFKQERNSDQATLPNNEGKFEIFKGNRSIYQVLSINRYTRACA